MNRNALADRVVKAANAALTAQGYVSPIDVLVGIGWLDARTVGQWRRGRLIASSALCRPTCPAYRKP